MDSSLLNPLIQFLKHYQFLEPPIILGGGALEFYGLRKCGYDLDIMISPRDKDNLKKLGYHLNLFGGKTEKEIDSTFSNILNLHLDLVVTLNQYDYHFFLSRASIYPGINNLKIISLEDLLLTKIFAKEYSNCPKHTQDVRLIIKGIEKKNYPHLHTEEKI